MLDGVDNLHIYICLVYATAFWYIVVFLLIFINDCAHLQLIVQHMNIYQHAACAGALIYHILIDKI